MWEANRDLSDATAALREAEQATEDRERAIQELKEQAKSLSSLREGVSLELDLLQAELQKVKKEEERIQDTILKKETQLTDAELGLKKIFDEENSLRESQKQLRTIITTSTQRLSEAREAAKRAKFEANPLNNPLLRSK